MAMSLYIENDEERFIFNNFFGDKTEYICNVKLHN